MGRLNARLRRIEGQARAQQMHVVTGHSDNEHWTKIDELIRSGKADADQPYRNPVLASSAVNATARPTTKRLRWRNMVANATPDTTQSQAPL